MSNDTAIFSFGAFVGAAAAMTVLALLLALLSKTEPDPCLIEIKTGHVTNQVMGTLERRNGILVCKTTP